MCLHSAFKQPKPAGHIFSSFSGKHKITPKNVRGFLSAETKMHETRKNEKRDGKNQHEIAQATTALPPPTSQSTDALIACAALPGMHAHPSTWEDISNWRTRMHAKTLTRAEECTTLPHAPIGFGRRCSHSCMHTLALPLVPGEELKGDDDNLEERGAGEGQHKNILSNRSMPG